MKKLLLIKIVGTLLLFSGCADFQTFLNNTPPDQVKADVIALGTVAKPYITLANAQKLHLFAVQVQTSSDYAQLIQLLPHTGNAAVDKYITEITQWVVKGGPYVTAVSQGILANY